MDALHSNQATGTAKESGVCDQILRITRVTGEFLNFYAIVYLEDGVRPCAIARADFVEGDGFIGFRQSARLREVENSVKTLANGVANLFGYPIRTTTDQNFLNCEHYSDMLEDLRIALDEQKRDDHSKTTVRVREKLH